MSKSHLSLLRQTRGYPYLKPRFSRPTWRFAQLMSRPYVRLVEGVKKITLFHQERLIEELASFYAGQQRLIIAFRHVAKEDAPLLMSALSRHIRGQVRSHNKGQIPSKRIIPHAAFLYGKDVLNWAGAITVWLFPRLHAIAVRNSQVDRTSIEILKQEIQAGAFPLALAPEGQVSYQMYQCTSLTTGLVSLVSWAQQSGQDVTVLPVAIGYRHANNPDRFVRQVLRRWQKATGVVLPELESAPLSQLLLEATEHCVELLQRFYAVESSNEASLREQIMTLCETALNRCEQSLQLSNEGTILQRLFRVRHRGLAQLYPEGERYIATDSTERHLADQRALEAQAVLYHSQIVDILEYIDPAYIANQPSAGRLCEYALNILDICNRIERGNIDSRYSPKGKHGALYIGTPLKIRQDQPVKTRSQQLELLTMIEAELQVSSSALEELWEAPSL